MLPTLIKRTTSTIIKPITKPRIPTLNDFRYFLPFNTRWSDNDMYGHLNNIKYVEYTDAIVNEFLINHAGLNPQSLTNPVGLVINSQFTYRESLEYPKPLIAALAVSKLGKSSVTYSVGLFDAEPSASSSSKGLGTFLSPPKEGAAGEGKWKDAKFNLEVRLIERSPAAYGTFTHVYVDPITRKSIAIPVDARNALEKLIVVTSE